MRKNIKSELNNRVASGMGSVADKITAEKELRRSVLACMLWEDLAYEDGTTVAERIRKLIPVVNPETVAKIAIEARNNQKLRHAPLLIVREMARVPTHKHLVAKTLAQVIQRPDEITEFLALYWAERKEPLSHQVKKGLASAFCKFNEYQLAKYNGGSGSIKLRDALFLCHAKAQNTDQEALWKRLINNELVTPDTWEVALSATGQASKKDIWTRLLQENKLGALALLRNLRNMKEANVNFDLIQKTLLSCNPEKVLPFRFISAVREAPDFRVELEDLMLRSLKSQEKIKGKTVVIVDVSGSMQTSLSSKSMLHRMDAAISLAMLIKGVSENCVVYATAGSDGARKHKTQLAKNVEGFALIDEIKKLADNLGGGGIFLKQCVDYAMEHEKEADTLIVISDSQDTSGDESPKKVVPFGKFNYMMDISCHKHGIAYNKFQVLNGFSEALVDYVIQDITISNKQ